MALRRILVVLAAIILGVGEGAADTDIGSDQPSVIRGYSDATTETFVWGTLITYYTTDTYGTKDVLAAIAAINPGMEIHPPHEHAEEEYLLVLEGSGEWHLMGQDMPASTGDMLYARPWDIHGIKNTGDVPLRFVVWKWNNKGVALPQQAM